jgi:hypothetical protein
MSWVTLSRPYGTRFDEGSSHTRSLESPEVRLWDMPDEIGPLSRHVKPEVLVVTRRFAGNHWKTGPQGLKPSPIAYWKAARLKPCPSSNDFSRACVEPLLRRIPQKMLVPGAGQTNGKHGLFSMPTAILLVPLHRSLPPERNYEEVRGESRSAG